MDEPHRLQEEPRASRLRHGKMSAPPDPPLFREPSRERLPSANLFQKSSAPPYQCARLLAAPYQ